MTVGDYVRWLFTRWYFYVIAILFFMNSLRLGTLNNALGMEYIVVIIMTLILSGIMISVCRFVAKVFR